MGLSRNHSDVIGRVRMCFFRSHYDRHSEAVLKAPIPLERTCPIIRACINLPLQLLHCYLISNFPTKRFSLTIKRVNHRAHVRTQTALPFDMHAYQLYGFASFGTLREESFSMTLYPYSDHPE